LNYGPVEETNNVCGPLECDQRTPNSPTLCLVFEDINDEVECLKISDTSCDTHCPTNYDPSPSLEGGTCVVTDCTNRVPIDGSCYMEGDTGSSLCYSLMEMGRCYSECPQLTMPNGTVSNNAKCDIIPCESRTPGIGGVCSIGTSDACFSFESKCYSQCPDLTVLIVVENVWLMYY
jgi:hypothetical protein